jgi:hypothetical protein
MTLASAKEDEDEDPAAAGSETTTSLSIAAPAREGSLLRSLLVRFLTPWWRAGGVRFRCRRRYAAQRRARGARAFSMLGEAGAVHWAHLKVNGLTPYRKSLVKFEAAQWSTVVVVEYCMDSYFTILKLS